MALVIDSLLYLVHQFLNRLISVHLTLTTCKHKQTNISLNYKRFKYINIHTITVLTFFMSVLPV